MISDLSVKYIQIQYINMASNVDLLKEYETDGEKICTNAYSPRPIYERYSR